MTENIGENNIGKEKEATCDCCGKPWSELPEFEANIPVDIANIKAGFKKVNTRIIKIHRVEHEDEDGPTIGSSWECKNCLGFTDDEYWDKINERNPIGNT